MVMGVVYTAKVGSRGDNEFDTDLFEPIGSRAVFFPQGGGGIQP